MAWVDNPPYRPFWAITKHEDIMAIERANDLFLSEPRPLLATAEADDALKAQHGRRHRASARSSTWTTRTTAKSGRSAPTGSAPKRCAHLKVRVDELAKRYVDKMRDIGPECDFVDAIAVNFPLYVILSLLGLPEDDFPRMHEADPGDVRRRRRRSIDAAASHGGPAGGTRRLLHLLRQR